VSLGVRGEKRLNTTGLQHITTAISRLAERVSASQEWLCYMELPEPVTVTGTHNKCRAGNVKVLSLDHSVVILLLNTITHRNTGCCWRTPWFSGARDEVFTVLKTEFVTFCVPEQQPKKSRILLRFLVNEFTDTR
jgi:hypothetical protein